MFLLDTNVISELRRPDRANQNVLRWTGAQDHRLFYISVATVMELKYGALILGHSDAAAGQIFVNWIDRNVLPDFSERTLHITAEVALICAGLHVPHKRGERDAWIAATALVHDLTVVTRNVRDFESTGVRLLNPWND